MSYRNMLGKLITAKRWRWVSRSLIVVSLVLGVSAAFNLWRQHVQYLRYPQIGRSIDIGGRTLNIYCAGAGTPTVIFETVSHQAGFSWSAVLPHVAKFARTCWYDRAGYGWSDPGPSPRTFRASAEDLHRLAAAAQLTPPYVLVGAFDAISEIRIYNGLYKNDVAGAVFVDGNNLDAYAHEIDTPDFIRGPWQKAFGSLSPYALASACLVIPAAQRMSVFLPKLGKPRPTPSWGLPEARHEQLDFLSDHAFSDACYVRRNEADVLAAGSFGDRPLIVLASARQRSRGANEKTLQAWNDWWVRTEQPSLAALSSKGRVDVVDGQVGLESIVEAVREVVTEVR